MSSPIALELPACVCSALRQVTRAITQFYDQSLLPSGLRSMQFFVLMSIRGHREASVSELTAFLRMDQTTVTRSLDVLERNLWIERVPKPDRRKRVFRLTQAGLDVLSQAEPLWATAQSHILSTLGHDDWQAAKPILGRLLKISCDATLGVAAAHPPESPAAGKNFVAGNS